MTITLGTARAQLRVRLDELTAQAWQDSELNQFINDSVRDIARRTMTLQGVATAAMLANTNQVLAPTDTIRVFQVLAYPTSIASGNEPVQLQYADHRQAINGYGMTGTGTPRVFSTWGYPPLLYINIFPKLDSAYELQIHYYKLPADRSTDGQTLDIVDGWVDLMLDGAEYMALRRDRDDRWKEAKALYEQKVEEAIEQTSRWVEANGMIQTPGGMYPAWLTSWD